MAGDINRVVITGNLTNDPELRSTPGGDTSVCSLRIACNGRRRTARPVSGRTRPTTSTSPCGARRARTASRYLARAARWRSTAACAWREWTTTEGQKRNAVDIIAESVQFLGGRDDAG